MRDARRFSSREVSQGVQRPVLCQTTWFGSTVVAHSGAAPLVFARLTAESCPADRPAGSSTPGASLSGCAASSCFSTSYPPACCAVHAGPPAITRHGETFLG